MEGLVSPDIIKQKRVNLIKVKNSDVHTTLCPVNLYLNQRFHLMLIQIP